MTSDSPIDGLDAARQAALALWMDARCQVLIYTPVVDPRFYDDVQMLTALRERVVEQPRLRVLWLLPSSKEWRGGCPRLLRLAESLPSVMELRALKADEPRERPEFAQAFMLADEICLLHFINPQSFTGSFERYRSRKMRQLSNFFMPLWDKSQPDPELRRLSL